MTTTWELDLLATSEAVPEVRRLLHRYDHDVRLCVTELLTNVIDHVGVGTPTTVRVVELPTRRTRVEVTDPDPRALPLLTGPVPVTDESGRGLALLDALALRWGVEQCGDRKTVWCELAGEPPLGDVREPAAPAVRSGR
ncbi:ATP-binding protein [Streptomyces coelicoflavus]|uniref:ATP-binding protein n=1 Tax=Streptomyces coelicoflavus TaxID=285562 RepID=UPI0036CA4C95